jgi:hypothetical protein
MRSTKANNGLAVVCAQFKGQWGISAIVSDDVFLFKKRDFSQPNLADWNLGPNNKLSVSTAGDPASPGDLSGLLGNPAYACNGVPVGYASLSQPFTMPRVPAGKRLALDLSYHTYTFDRNMGLIDDYGRFDVLFNGNRALSDMNQSRNNDSGCAAARDLGRKAISIPMMGNPGDNINVTFRLTDLPDALYNTYVYVDDVPLRFE